MRGYKAWVRNARLEKTCKVLRKFLETPKLRFSPPNSCWGISSRRKSSLSRV
jgi:hypothetical protein